MCILYPGRTGIGNGHPVVMNGWSHRDKGGVMVGDLCELLVDASSAMYLQHEVYRISQLNTHMYMMTHSHALGSVRGLGLG